jgi:RNA polymerase sigma-70 factor (ECF subfamily)
MEINTIHSQFHNILRNYIVARVNNRDDAADILQEVFIKIASNLHSLTGDEKLKSWIFTITKNAIIDYYRKNATNRTTSMTENTMDNMHIETDFDATKGLEKCLEGFIQRLPEEYRDIIIDSEIKGIKQKDLIEKYNLAYPSVRSRVQRGRSRLKDMLLACCKVELDSRGSVLEVIPQHSSNNSCGICN